MINVQVSTTETPIAAAGARDFLHIYNDSTVVVYLRYDGGAVPLTTINGYPLQPGATLILENWGVRNIYNKAVSGLVAAGTANLRIHGDGS